MLDLNHWHLFICQTFEQVTNEAGKKHIVEQFRVVFLLKDLKTDSDNPGIWAHNIQATGTDTHLIGGIKIPSKM